MNADGPQRPVQDDTTFQAAAANVVSRLQADMARLVRALPGRISRAADVQRALKVDAKLGWQVYRTATARSPSEAGSNIPQRVSFDRLLRTARARGVPEDIVTELGVAFDRFEAFVLQHAGERDSFESMIASLGSEARESLDLRHKKGAFKANAHLRGAQALTQFKTAIVFPSQKPDHNDLVVLRGMVDLLRSNPIVPLVLAQHFMRWSQGPIEHVKREPLDANAEVGKGVSVLRGFSSDPLPTVRTIGQDSGALETQLMGMGIGRTAATTIVTGEIVRDELSPYAPDPENPDDDSDPVLTSHAAIGCPVETLVHDVLFHRQVFDLERRLGRTGGQLLPKVFVYDTADPGFQPPEPPRLGEPHVLAIEERATFLGSGADAAATVDVPRYVELIRFACQRVGIDPADLMVYRCRVEYPLLPSTVAVRFELPKD